MWAAFKPYLALTAACFLSVSASSSPGQDQPQAPAGDARILSLADVNARYDSLAGHRVRVQGFLIVEGRTSSLHEGRSRTGEFRQVGRGADRATYWCAYLREPHQLEIAELPRASTQRVERFARQRNRLIAQRVVLEGILSPRNLQVDQTIFSPDAVISNKHIGRLLEPEIVSVERVFCSGVPREN